MTPPDDPIATTPDDPTQTTLDGPTNMTPDDPTIMAPDDPENATPGDRLAELTALTLKFRDDRNWRQFHTAKELALCLALETAEVVELMQWRNGAELEKHLEDNKGALAEELSDVLHAVLLLAHDHGIDLASAYREKMKKNAVKYPVEKARNQAKKYDQL
jgi:NTP pyrophosphatase (non-canonical NTP hydrolase)